MVVTRSRAQRPMATTQQHAAHGEAGCALSANEDARAASGARRRCRRRRRHRRRHRRCRLRRAFATRRVAWWRGVPAGFDARNRALTCTHTHTHAHTRALQQPRGGAARDAQVERRREAAARRRRARRSLAEALLVWQHAHAVSVRRRHATRCDAMRRDATAPDRHARTVDKHGPRQSRNRGAVGEPRIDGVLARRGGRVRDLDDAVACHARREHATAHTPTSAARAPHRSTACCTTPRPSPRPSGRRARLAHTGCQTHRGAAQTHTRTTTPRVPCEACTRHRLLAPSRTATHTRAASPTRARLRPSPETEHCDAAGRAGCTVTANGLPSTCSPCSFTEREPTPATVCRTHH